MDYIPPKRLDSSNAGVQRNHIKTNLKSGNIDFLLGLLNNEETHLQDATFVKACVFIYINTSKDNDKNEKVNEVNTLLGQIDSKYYKQAIIVCGVHLANNPVNIPAAVPPTP